MFSTNNNHLYLVLSIRIELILQSYQDRVMSHYTIRAESAGSGGDRTHIYDRASNSVQLNGYHIWPNLCNRT